MLDRTYSLYILRCADQSYYTGIAKDVPRRLQEHRNGSRGAKYLRGRSPFEIVFECPVGDRSTASRLEYRVKRLSRREKESLIAGNQCMERLSRIARGKIDD